MSVKRIKEYEVGEVVFGKFGVLESQIKRAANGPYLAVKLTDGTNDIMGKMWRYQDSRKPGAGSVVTLEGTVGSYKGTKDLNISQLELVMEDFKQFQKQGPSRESLEDRLEDVLVWVSYESGDLIKAVYKQVEERVPLWELPGAKFVHHAYVGGLMEHMIECAEYIYRIDDPRVNRDIAITSALLHDIGKAYTYTWNKLAIEMTDKGKLFDHIILGLEAIKMGSLHASHKNLDLILHCVASHHGKLEHGSPVVGKCPEAVMVHAADLISSRLAIMNEATENCDDLWTDKVWSLGTEVYNHKLIR